jgi:hypothetical protein
MTNVKWHMENGNTSKSLPDCLIHEEGFYATPRSEVNIAGVAFDKTSDSGAPGSDAAVQPVLQVLQ